MPLRRHAAMAVVSPRVRSEDVGLAPAKQINRIAAAYRLGLELG
jgi:hypothetical protein